MTSKKSTKPGGQTQKGRWLGSKMRFASADDPIYSLGSVVGGRVLKGTRLDSSESEKPRKSDRQPGGEKAD